MIHHSFIILQLSIELKIFYQSFSNSFSKFQFLNGQSVGEMGVFFPQGATNTVSETVFIWLFIVLIICDSFNILGYLPSTSEI